MSAAASQCLIITGMHRSGTSLTAAFLQVAGVDIGGDLLPGHHDNPKGYFEDRQFLDFHNRILQESGETIFCLRDLSLDGRHQSDAARLVSGKAGIWGWKDPRTSLFLPFWKSVIPEAKCLFLYRHPMKVVDSLLRRGTDTILKRKPWLAADAWIHYNRKIIDFARRYPDDCIVVEIDSLVSDPVRVIERLNGKYALKLKISNAAFDCLFDSRLLAEKIPMTHLRTRIVSYIRRTQFNDVYNQLHTLSLA